MSFRKRLLSLLSIIGFSITSVSCSTGIGERRNDTSSTLYVGVVGTSFPTSFMPWLSRDGIAPTIATMLFSTLFTYDDSTASYKSNLAKSWCYVDYENNPLTTDGKYDGEVDYSTVDEYYSSAKDDYMMIRVDLFDDIKWSDGHNLTVEDVYYTFDLATDYSFSNHAGALVWTGDLQHESEGGVLKEQGMFTYEHPDESGMFGIDDDEKDTVIYLKVDKVLGAIATLFTTILVLPRHIYQGEISADTPLNSKDTKGVIKEQAINPVCSGPYKLDRDKTNSEAITLVRNNNYHLKSEDGSDLYKVDTIKFLLYLDINTAIYAIRKGYLDVLNSSISTNYIKLFDENDDIKLMESKGTSVSSLVLNINPKSTYDSGMKTLFKDKDFRRAISLSIDQDELIEKVLNSSGDKGSNGLFLKNSSLYNPDSDKEQNMSLEERLTEANRILDTIHPDKDSSGYRLYNGKRISFEIISNQGYQDTINYLQRQFYKIGIEVIYKAGGSSIENTYLFTSDFDMTIQSVILSYSNADTMLKAHFITQDHSSNYGRYNDDSLTALINEMRQQLNRDKKIELLKEIQTVIADSYYKIPLYTTDVVSIYRTDRFDGFRSKDGETAFNDNTLKNLVKVEA